MTETKSERRPRRDPDGRLATIGDLLGTALAGLVIGVILLLAFEAILALTGAEFGKTSGWLALILPLWLFTDEFRAIGHGAQRFVVALVAAAVGVAAGMTFAGLAATAVPALVSGFVGAGACTVAYCLVWFYGLRWLSHRAG